MEIIRRNILKIITIYPGQKTTKPGAKAPGFVVFYRKRGGRASYFL
jgi:hypothetical protein